MYIHEIDFEILNQFLKPIYTNCKCTYTKYFSCEKHKFDRFSNQKREKKEEYSSEQRCQSFHSYSIVDCLNVNSYLIFLFHTCNKFATNSNISKRRKKNSKCSIMSQGN